METEREKYPITNPFKLSEILALAGLPALSRNEQILAENVRKRGQSSQRDIEYAHSDFYLPDGTIVMAIRSSPLIIEGWERHFINPDDQKAFVNFQQELFEETGDLRLPRELFIKAKIIAQIAGNFLQNTIPGKGTTARNAVQFFLRQEAGSKQKKAFLFAVWCYLNH